LINALKIIQMKTLKKYILIVAVLFLGLGACTDNFEEINTNPQAFNFIDPGVQLTKIQLDLSGNREEIWRYELGICSPMVQYFAGSWWCQHGGQYNVVEKNHWFTLWEEMYPRDIKNVVDVIDRTEGDEFYQNTRAAARILKVYMFSKLTDLYGDVPYFDAAKGSTDRIFQPKYDKQEDIYADFFLELDEAVKDLDAQKEGVRGDIMYNGDVEKWKRFGNSLRMRLGFRLEKVNPTEAEKQVKAAIEGGVMESNDHMCKVQHMNFDYVKGENRGNGRAQVFHASDDSEGYRLTNTFVDHLKATNDPRLFIYGGTYLSVAGREYGQDISEYLQMGITHGAMWWNEWSDYGDLEDEDGNYIAYVDHGHKHMMPSKYVADFKAPFFHMTYAEVELLLAEAALRDWGSTGAAAHYEKAIKASMAHCALYPGAPVISDDVVEAYIAANPLPTTSPEDMIAIHDQMWVNLYMDGVESYCSFRRSGYPELVPFESVEWYSSGTGGVIPRRFFYPEFEAINNPESYQEAIDRMGGTDDWLSRVWWDKN